MDRWGHGPFRLHIDTTEWSNHAIGRPPCRLQHLTVRNVCRDLIPLVVQRSECMTEVHIIAPAAGDWNDVQDALREANGDQLTRVRIRSTYDSSTESYNKLRTLPAGCRITHMETDTAVATSLPLNAFTSVTTFEATSYTDGAWTQWRSMFASMSGLTRLSLDDVGMEEDGGEDGVTLPQVTDLFVGYGDDYDLELIAKLHLPSLKSLSVATWIGGTVAAFGARCPTILRAAHRVKIAMYPQDGRSMAGTVRLLQQAQEIDLARCGSDLPLLFDALKQDPTFKLPQLMKLKVSGKRTKEGASEFMDRFAEGCIIETATVQDLAGRQPRWRYLAR
ncbi:hypothetical protein DFH06DRAFT_1339522 [Mycena polygramma]|nr:hypothetical protein DFH06DRAFT_1144427 [Mycena polygramma]KAJ7626383.1 hypothetical protein DFH06DRAFT_1339522 [Mycena polygramma]